MPTTKEQFLAVFDKILAELVADLRSPELGMPESVCDMTREVCGGLLHSRALECASSCLSTPPPPTSTPP